MKNYFSLSSVPMDEPAKQVGQASPAELKEEANRYREQLQKRFPQYDKMDCRFLVQQNRHDFGVYYDVIIEYTEPGIMEMFNDSVEFALFVEERLPRYWNDSSVYTFEADEEAELQTV